MLAELRTKSQVTIPKEVVTKLGIKEGEMCAVMGKSGLFRDYLIKSAQVITWFSLDPNSGFTYWPDGPLKAPKRLMPPVWNRGVVVQNEMLMHRGEAWLKTHPDKELITYRYLKNRKQLVSEALARLVDEPVTAERETDEGHADRQESYLEKPL